MSVIAHRTSFKGLIGFIVAAISAAFSILAILTWLYIARTIVGDFSGGVAFAMNIEPLLATWAGIAISPVALILTSVSAFKRESNGRRSFTIFHIFAPVLLVPAGLLLLRMISR
ncbi:MAG: hypothetical protein ABI073_13265 [Luteolibacter sp.]